jgi:serine/threonine protein kinase, bacterial
MFLRLSVAGPALRLAAALALVACGGGGDAPSPTTAPPVAAPVITTQPASQSAAPGASVSFGVAATGSGLSYAWSRAPAAGAAFVAMAGATQATLTVGPVDTSMNGQQVRVVVQNAGGIVTSDAATLTVAATASAPVITGQPADQVAVLPEDNDFDSRRAVFVVAATGSPTPTVQWQVNTDPTTATYTDIPGATGNAYSPPGLTFADSGKRWRAVLRNAVGTVASRGALLQVADLGLGGSPRGFAVRADGVVVAGIDTPQATFAGVRSATATRVRTLAGGATGTPLDGTGSAARFSLPRTLVLDAAGNAYLIDGLIAAWVRKVTPQGAVSTLAGNGVSGFVDGSGAQARFNNPNGLVLGADGSLYVADTGNSAIRRITPAGVVSTVAGGTPGSADGVGVSAQFTNPFGLAVDASGQLWVAEAAPSCRIRKLAPDSAVTTVSNTGCGARADGALGTTARFVSPTHLAFDGAGNLFVSDQDAIRRVTPAGTVSSPRVFSLAEGLYTHGPLAADASGHFYVARARPVSNGVHIERNAADGSRAQLPQ